MKERQTFERASEVLRAARSSGLFVVYVVVSFRPDYPEVSDRNLSFRERKNSGSAPAADPASLIHLPVVPHEREPVLVKHRVKHRANALSCTGLDMILRTQGFDTLILMGHATSGVILSPVRYGADADYCLIVVEDGCADRDLEVHQLLMQKVFLRQAVVASSQEVVTRWARPNGYRVS